MTRPKIPRLPTVAKHLTIEEVTARFRAADSSVLKTHLQVVMLALRGFTVAGIMEATSLSRAWVFSILKRYNEEGPDALGDGRRNNGGERYLDDEGLDALRLALQGTPPGGGLWTAPKVQRWILERTGERVDPVTAWRYLGRAGFTVQVPRPTDVRSDPEEREKGKKN